jgi:hypothetical protein
MEADWEVEVGGGAPVIEALWAGFVDLRHSPERIAEIAEVAAFPALAGMLLALNAPGSPVWTAKCDLWEPEAVASAGPNSPASAALACYVDVLPLEGRVFAQWQQAEAFCREWVARLALIALPECRVDLVIRQAIAGPAEGFGITAYLSAEGRGRDRSAVSAALEAAMIACAGALPSAAPTEAAASKLQ